MSGMMMVKIMMMIRAWYTPDQDDERVVAIDCGADSEDDRYDGDGDCDDGGGGEEAHVVGHGRDDVHRGGRSLQPRLQCESLKVSIFSGFLNLKANCPTLTIDLKCF